MKTKASRQSDFIPNGMNFSDLERVLRDLGGQVRRVKGEVEFSHPLAWRAVRGHFGRKDASRALVLMVRQVQRELNVRGPESS